MADTVTRVEKRVSRALSSFQKAHDAIVDAESEADAELVAIDAQISSLRAYMAQVATTRDKAADVRRKLAELVLA